MLIQIDENSEVAIYVQLRNQIVHAIAMSTLQEGDPLPSVRQLADHIGVNMHTVNKAYHVLRQEGFIRMDKRCGAVVEVDVNHLAALQEMREQMLTVLAEGICKGVSREESHLIVDELYDMFFRR